MKIKLLTVVIKYFIPSDHKSQTVILQKTHSFQNKTKKFTSYLRYYLWWVGGWVWIN